MKRFLIVFIIVLLIPVSTYAQEYQDYLNSFDLSSFDTLDKDSKAFLEELGVLDFDYQSISDISISDVGKYIISIVKKQSQGPIKSGITVILFILLSSFFQSFNSEISKSDMSSLFSTTSNLVISIFLVSRLTDCIGLCCSTIKICSDFAFAFFPAFCIIVSTAGGAVTSFSTNTTLLVLAQGLNYISQFIFIPITNCFLAIGICSGIRQELNLSSIASILKKVITTSISILSTVFVSVLSVKTAVASRADALGLRSVRFAINSVVPVIGSSISEGLLSIQSYSSLIKTSVGIVGILAVVSIFLPALIEINIWRAVLSLSGLCGEVFGNESSVNAVRTFKDTLLIIDVILILTMLTTIISIGVLVAAKTAG